MFVWFTIMLSLLSAPLMLVFGRPRAVTTTRGFVTADVAAHFPVSSRTPVVWIQPWPWLRRRMDTPGRVVHAWTWGCFVILGTPGRWTEAHECVHVIQTSCVGPLLGVSYVLDLVVCAPWRRWFPPYRTQHMVAAEHVARIVTGASPPS